MRIWIEQDEKNIFFKFQPDTAEESKILDDFLKFDYRTERSTISDNRDKTVRQGAEQMATVWGHETERTVVIPKK